MSYFVYVIKSLVDGDLYTGSCEDVEKRLHVHNSGKVRSTKSRKPFVLVYKEICDTRTEARKRENYLKSGIGRKYLKEKIQGS
jgi:putative endonuclease